MGQPVRFGGTSWWRVSPPNLFVYALVIGPGHRLHLLAVTAPERRSHLVGDGSRRSKSSVGPAREPDRSIRAQGMANALPDLKKTCSPYISLLVTRIVFHTGTKRSSLKVTCHACSGSCEPPVGRPFHQTRPAGLFFADPQLRMAWDLSGTLSRPAAPFFYRMTSRRRVFEKPSADMR
jgi:hypothetical protein